MAFQTIYEYTGTQYGRTVTVQLQENSAATLTKDDIEINNLERRGGSESNNIANPIIGQIFTADIVDRNWINNGSIYEKLRTTSPGDIKVIINIGGVTWNGFVALTTNRRDYEPKYDTFNIRIKFVDGFFLLKSKQKSLTSIFFYENMQEALDEIGLGYDTYWIMSYEDIISTETNNIDTFILTLKGDLYSYIKAVLEILNCQIFQYDGDWYVVERSVDTDDRSQDLASYQYKVATGTYSLTNINGSTLSQNESISENDLVDGVTLDIIPAIAITSVNVTYAFSSPSTLIQDNLNRLTGIEIKNYDGFPSTFQNWDTSASGISVSRSDGSGDFDSGWCIVDTLSAGSQITSEWFGVINIDQYQDVGLKFVMDSRVNLPTSDETGNTYTLDYLEIRFKDESGNTWWLKEDGTWATSQTKFTFSYQANSFGVPGFITESFDLSVDFPTTSNEAGWIEVDIDYSGDTGQFEDLGVSPITMIVNSELGNTSEAYAFNPMGTEEINITTDVYANTTINPGGIYDVLGGNNVNMAISYKSKFYKLSDITALKKAAQQHTPLKKLKGSLHSYNINPLNTYLAVSSRFRLQAWRENVFDRVAEMVFSEYDYDETNITLRRGIYS